MSFVARRSFGEDDDDLHLAGAPASRRPHQTMCSTIRLSRLVELGQELFPRERQTPEVLGVTQKADAEKWWPIIRQLGIRAA
jgi:hypothetical protein